MPLILLLVAVGSALGGVTRYLAGLFVHQRVVTTFPVGTLVVNVVGCALIGFVMRYLHATDPASAEWRVFLTTGFCGGFTTFSAFSYDAVVLLEEGSYAKAGVYIATSLVLSIVAVYGGFAGAKVVLGAR